MIRPELTVAAIAERNGRFLMVEEWVRGEIRFNQPAGHVEPDESFEQAVIRETLEETGEAFTPEALIGSFLWQPEGSSDMILRTVFTGQCQPERVTDELDDGIIAAHWLTVDEIRALGDQLRSPLVLESIAAWKAGKRLPLDAICCHPAPTPA